MSNNLLIKGEVFEDERGTLRFVNAFNMEEVVRFYEIAPKNQEIIRAWQGHQFEKKWFYCLSGSFVINIVEINDFNNPSDGLIPIRMELDSSKAMILAVPNGFATGIKAASKNSRLQVFSNASLEESKDDDFRFPLGKWSAEW
ncbi:MAG: sugar epimerase [Bacteroidota bacterium]|nr:sugar epimerase [Bacteroidota bacterium]